MKPFKLLQHVKNCIMNQYFFKHVCFLLTLCNSNINLHNVLKLINKFKTHLKIFMTINYDQQLRFFNFQMTSLMNNYSHS